MKKVILILFSLPLFVQAQLMPQLILGYQNPNDWNKPLDSTYVPGLIYRVDYYRLSPNKIDLILNSHYEIETDNFWIKKQTQFIDEVTQNTIYDKYANTYNYSSNRLIAKTSELKRVNTNNMLTWRIDSIKYNSEGLVEIEDRWMNNLDSNIMRRGIGVQFVYDSLNRFIENKPYNLIPKEDVIYGGFIRVDSFNNSNLPIRITPYSVTLDTGFRGKFVNVISHDSLSRVSSFVSFSAPFEFQPFFRNDSIRYFYNGSNLYPDSFLGYGSNRSQTINTREIYLYDDNGKIAEILSYQLSNRSLRLTERWVYTKLLNSSVDELAKNENVYSIFPNPNNGNFTLTFKNDIPNCVVTIYNALGKEVYSNNYQNSNSVEINNNLNRGIYFINIQSATLQATKKFIVE
jgi:hypothetical protein